MEGRQRIVRLKTFLTELEVTMDKRKELRHVIINALSPGGMRLKKALDNKENIETIILSRRDAQILMDGLNKVYKFLGSIKTTK